jgi:hypothetical protein
MGVLGKREPAPASTWLLVVLMHVQRGWARYLLQHPLLPLLLLLLLQLLLQLLGQRGPQSVEA